MAPTVDLEDFGKGVTDWGRVEVTDKCYGNMACRALAPELFLEVKAASRPALQGAFSEVGRDVRDKHEYQAVRRAIVSCPVKAIRWTRPAQLGRESGCPPPLYAGFPKVIEDQVYHVGYASMPTFAAQSYFIRRDDGRNMLIDPPEAAEDLVEALRTMGGVRFLLFTHEDHTGNHQRWHDLTEAPRLIHKSAVVHTKDPYSPLPVTSMFEMQLTLQPMDSSQPLEGVPELRAVHTPGHSKGDLCFVYRDKFLFTGDVLAHSPALGHLIAHRIECWKDWSELTRNILSLQSQRFLWVLPGHGDWRHFSTEEEAQSAVRECAAWMEKQDAGRTWLLRFLLWFTLRSKKNRLLYVLADNVVLPPGARKHLPNWTVPAAFWWAALLVPAVGVGAACWRSSRR